MCGRESGREKGEERETEREGETEIEREKEIKHQIYVTDLICTHVEKIACVWKDKEKVG